MYNPMEVEKEILKFWENEKIFEKLREKNKGKKKFSFIDGPITANNPMGVHHAWGRTYKDLYVRFKALKGFDQRYQNGFDCQGLHVEVEVEKQLGFNSKKDIESFGLDKFSKASRERVNKQSEGQTQQSIRLGQWMDWNNSYYTMADNNIEGIWFFLKKCFENGWLYKGGRILPWCTRCGTASSKHEMSDGGYANLTHPSVYVKAKLKGKENEFLLVWTTTEWTLSSNVAVAVNPELDYSKVKVGNEVFYIASNLLDKISGEKEELEKVKGKELVDLTYESFYPEFEVQKFEHKVVAWKDVSSEEGTGIVHIAPTCGEEDFELGKEINLPMINPALDEQGNYLEGFGWQTGRNVKEIKKKIVEELEERDILYKEEQYTHRYPVCWRCNEELVFRQGKEWYIKSDEIRPKMKIAAKTVEWQPEYVGKLMQDWLDNMGDWNISRKRYWGLPLMFFECECGKLEVIGSLKELKEKAVNPEKVDSLPELHRPWIDEVKVKCECGKEITRIKEVGDCWLDAGIVPFSTMKYFEDKSYWKEWFPADLITEMRAQVRLWFYSMLFMSVTLEGVSPYKKVMAYEALKDEKGEDMHKSKGNAIWFDEAVEKVGADVMRWLYTKQSLNRNLLFGYNNLKEAKKPLDNLNNIYFYLQQALRLNNFDKNSKVERLELEDEWLNSRINSLNKKVTESLDKLEPYTANNLIEEFFVNDLSRGYIQFVRARLQFNGKNKEACLQTLYNSSLKLLVLMAPFTPFLTEHLYQKTFKETEKIESIHLLDWPESKEVNESLEEKMSKAREVMQQVLFEREKLQMGIRWPLKEVTVKMEKVENLKEFKELIMRQVNCKEVTLVEGKELVVEVDSTMTLELEMEGFSRELVRYVQDSRKEARLQKEDKITGVLESSSEKIIKAFEKYKEEIQEKTNSSFSLGKTEGFEKVKEKKVKGETFKIGWKKEKN
ncbi:MAG: isoleucine--tRNA ligase [archaeon]